MEPNQIHPDNILPPTQTPNEIEQTKKLSKRILLIVFLILAILIPSALFAYSKLKPAEYKSVSLATPTPISSPKPSAKAADPTADWKTYISNEYNFSLKYPPTIQETDLQDREDQVGSANLIGGASFGLIYNDNVFRPQASEIHVEVFDAEGLDLDEWLSQHSSTQPFGAENKEFAGFKETENKSLSGITGVEFSGDVMGFQDINIAVKKDDYVYVFGNVKVADDLSQQFNQMLSTFKFTDQANPSPSASPEQTACTQEAKLCPDGSYVSREAPNCDFSPCPE